MRFKGETGDMYMWVSLTKVIGAWFFLVITSVMCLTESVLASENATIDMEEAITRTLARSPALVAFGYQLEVQQARVTQSQLRPNPELGVLVENVLGTGEYEGTDGSETTLSIGWVLERGKLESRVVTARAGVSLFESEAEVQRLDVIAQTARLFLVSLANQERLVQMQQAVTLSKQTVAIVKTRVNAGRTPDADLARAEAQLARIQLEREGLEHELLTSNYRLSTQWGDFEPDFSKVTGDLRQLPMPVDFSSLLAQVDQNPSLSSYVTHRRLREAELHLAEAEAKPSWRLSAGVRRLELTNDNAFVAEINIPLATRKQNQGRIAEARANIALSDANQAATRLQIETQMFAVYQALQHSLHQSQMLREEVLPRVEKALADTQRAYESGRYDYSVLQLLQGEVLDTRTALVETSIEAHAHLIEIERLTGTAMPSVFNQP
jgi:cobalt-zinc-cadmium efflux system outer membrane protein